MKKKPLLSKVQIINETVKYYGKNPMERRAISRGLGDRDKCMYLTNKGQMCAIGRCLKNPETVVKFLRKKIDSVFAGVATLRSLYRKNHKPIPFKEKYKGHDLQFWIDLQELHDNNAYWYNTHLSEIGDHYVDRLHKKWKNK